MISIINKIKVFCKDSLVIFRSRNTSFWHKLVLWLNYTKITTLLFLDGRFINLKHVKFLGYTLHFVSFYELFLLIKEIFIREIYFFESDKKNPIIFDAGSNIGISVLYFKHLYPHSKVTAFEPSPESFEVLKKNIEKNNLSNVNLNNIGLSDKKDTAEFYIRKGMSLASTMVKEERVGSEKVEINTDKLSSYIKSNIDLLKIDIQLLEAKVLKDLFESNSLDYIQKIRMEAHYLPEYKDNQLSLILEILDKSGYIYSLDLNTVKPNGFATYTLKANK